MKNEPGPHALELRIPPAAVVFLVGLSMWLVRRFAPGFNFDLPFRALVAVACGAAGLGAAALGFAAFRRAKTTVNPMKPGSSSSLVRSGIYRVTRNPMYLGFLAMLMGWFALNANFLGLLALPAFVLYMNRFQIAPEERALRGIFGDDFRAYCAVVRRWI